MSEKNNDGITQIFELKEFGIFKDFTWSDEIPLFGKKNLIYGWNYSGKTTLSRLFQNIELEQAGYNKINADFLEGAFRIEYSKDGTLEKNINNFPFNVKVFNQKYIERIFTWTSSNPKIDAILFRLGDVPAELESKISLLDEDIKKLQAEEEKNLEKISSFNSYVKVGFAGLAGIIRDKKFEGFYQPKHFNVNRVSERAEKIKDNLDAFNLKGKEIDELNKAYGGDEYKAQHIGFKPLQGLEFLKKEVEEILNSIPEISDLDSMMQEGVKLDDLDILKKDNVLSDWVKQGVGLHKDDGEKCKFCHNHLAEDRMKALNSFYSGELDKLEQKIKLIREKIENEKHALDISFLDESKIAKYLKNEYNEAISEYRDMSSKYKEQIEILESNLVEKEKSIFEEISASSIEEVLLSKEVGHISSIIENHNEHVNNHEQEKEKAINNLVNHYIAVYMEETEYLEKKNQHDIAEIKNGEINPKIKEFENQIADLKYELEGIAEGKDALNENIRILLNANSIRIDIHEEGKFYLMRDDVPATNLSEGEKTAIAFSYFITEIESLKKTNELSKTIVFIDDPISSLDSNHVFQTCSLIGKLFKGGEFCQLFLSTHSFEFLSMLVNANLFSVRGRKKDNIKFYLIERKQDSGSSIREMPKAFLKHRSEYVALFSILQEHNESEDKSDVLPLLTLSNVLRRVVELYTLMKYPSTEKVNMRLKKIIDEMIKDNDSENIEDNGSGNIKHTHHLKAIMNYFSHLEDMDRLIYNDDKIFKISDLIKDFIEYVKEHDSLHWQGLEEVFESNNEEESKSGKG